MKYQEALAQKGLEKSSLSKAIQKKIENFEELVREANKYSKESDLDEDEKSNLDGIKKRVNILDNELVKSINKFNPEVQAQRMKRLESLNEAKKNAGVLSPMPEKPVEVLQPSPVEEVKAEVVEVEQENLNLDIEHHDIEEEKQETENLNVHEDSYPELPEYDDTEFGVKHDIEVIDDEEFARAGDAKPKKDGLSYTLIAIGALLITAGAVNLFRNKK